MTTLDLLFGVIVQFSLLAFLLLGACTVILWFVRQPIERIRSIQITFCCVLCAAILSRVSWKPAIELPWLPPGGRPGTVDHPEARLSAAAAISSSSALIVGAEVDPTMSPLNEPGGVSSVSGAAGDSLFRPRPSPWQHPIRRAVVLGFLGVSLAQLAYLLVGFLATQRLITNASPLSESAQSRVRRAFSPLSDQSKIRLATSTRIQVPLVSGIIHPVILLPAELTTVETESLTLRHSLAHEWQHIIRKDLVTWQLVTFCQVLLWPQPFYWFLRRELRVSQDQIADGFAAEQTHQHVAYAESLVRFARARQVAVLGALSMGGRKSALLRRVELLLNDSFHISASTRMRINFGFAGAMIAAVILLASLQLTRSAASEAEPANGTTTAGGEDNANPSGKVIQPVEHSGFVFDAATNKPIEGATVIVTRMNSGDWRELDITESTTDAQGRYTFVIPPDQLKQRLLYIMFDLRHPDYAPRHCGSYGYAMVQKNLELGSKPWFAKLRMVPGSTISGRLVDEQGNPVVGAQLRGRSEDPSVEGLTGSSSAKAVSDGEGRFELQVTREGTAGLSIVPLNHSMKHVDVGAKRGDLGDIVLSEGFTIRGRVLDAKGTPLEGLWVNLTPVAEADTASYEMKRSSKTDRRGEFRTRPLSPGEYSVEVEAKATGAIEKAKYANFHHDPPPRNVRQAGHRGLGW